MNLIIALIPLFLLAAVHGAPAPKPDDHEGDDHGDDEGDDHGDDDSDDHGDDEGDDEGDGHGDDHGDDEGDDEDDDHGDDHDDDEGHGEEGHCCYTKTVGDIEYHHHGNDETGHWEDLHCLDGCLYVKVDDPDHKRFCFASGDLEVACGGHDDGDDEEEHDEDDEDDEEPHTEGPEDTDEPHSEPEGSTEPHSEPEGSTEPHSEPESTTEPHSEPESTSEPHSEPESTTEPHSEPESTTEPHSEPESTPEDGGDSTTAPEPTTTAEAPEFRISWTTLGPTEECIAVGTKVTFAWSTGHNVNILTTAEEYEGCTGFTDTSPGSGPFEWVADTAGEHYFACGVATACSIGIKAKLTVAEDCPED